MDIRHGSVLFAEGVFERLQVLFVVILGPRAGDRDRDTESVYIRGLTPQRLQNLHVLFTLVADLTRFDEETCVQDHVFLRLVVLRLCSVDNIEGS